MTTSSQIYEVLGGAALLGATAPSLEGLRDQVRAGLPYGSLEAAADRLHLERDEISDLLMLPQRTLSRRKKGHRLRPDESDRLFRLARVVAHAVEVLGSWEKATRWLRRPNRALGSAVPLEFLDTDAGARRVEQLLGRVEHGVYS
jgi:putative toxin-antitoxin system antitoxin component (TIGR02293 family)